MPIAAMSLIEKIQSKPYAYKIKLLWTIILCVTAFMVLVWALSSRINTNSQKETTLFKTIGRGLKDIKEKYSK